MRTQQRIEQQTFDLLGIFNLRDYGGYPLASGGRLKSQTLFRSGQHRDATPDDLAIVEGLGLAAVIDLRSARERRVSPCVRPGLFNARIYRSDDNEAVLAPHEAAAERALDPEMARQSMCAAYREMPVQPYLIRAWTSYFEALAVTGGASLVHCVAGKDRTGLAVALFHDMVGVHQDDLLADYLLTNEMGDLDQRVAVGAKHIRTLFGQNSSDEAIRVLMGVCPEFLDAGFAEIRRLWGSLERYREEVLGVTSTRKAAILSQLVI